MATEDLELGFRVPSHGFISEAMSFMAECNDSFTGARRCLSIVVFLLILDTDELSVLEILAPQRKQQIGPDGSFVYSNTSSIYGDDCVTDMELYASG